MFWGSGDGVCVILGGSACFLLPLMYQRGIKFDPHS